MPTLDDEAFENYLKQFRPIVPDSLVPAQRSQHSWRHRSVWRIWAIGFAVALIFSAFILDRASRHPHPAHSGSNTAGMQVVSPVKPLTMRDADALLSAAPSYKAAVNSIAFHHQEPTIPKDKQSALAVLAKEKVRL